MPFSQDGVDFSVSKQTNNKKSFVKKYYAEKYGFFNTVCKIDIIGFNNSSFLPF
jgi:hypothetical protein